MSKTKAGTFLFALLLAAGVGCIYLPGLDNGLVFDDVRLTDGGVFGRYGALWPVQQRLLSYGSFVWLDALPGMRWAGQRGVNIVLHLATVAGIYCLLRQLLAFTRLPDEIVAAPRFSASREAALRVGVAVFALNPVAVYAVGYLIQRSIVLATCCAVWACWAFVRGLRGGGVAWYAGALVLYICSLLSKEHTVMLAAFAVPLYVFVRRPTPRQVAGIAFGGLALVGVAAAVLLQNYGPVIGRVFDPTSQLLVGQLDQLHPGVAAHPWLLSIVNEAWLFFRYGAMWLLPNPQWMSIDLRPDFPLTATAFPQVLGLIGYVALFAASVWLLLRRRGGALALAAVCMLFPLLLYGTEFSTVWVQDPFVLYRSYLWAALLPGLVALPLVGLPPRALYAGAVVVGLLFIAGGVERTLSLQNNLTAWTDAVEKVDLQAPPNAVGRWRPYLNRGSEYLDQQLLEPALSDFAAAERLGEPNGAARFDTGMALLLQQKYPEALAAFDAAEAAGNHDFNVYLQRGETRYAMGNFSGALQDFSTALRSEGALSEADTGSLVRETLRLRRAESAVAAGQYPLAIEDYRQLLAARPTSARFQIGMGMALAGGGRAGDALPIFDKVIAERPNAQAYYGRAIARHYTGDAAGALQDIDHAIRIDAANPTYRALRAQLGGARR